MTAADSPFQNAREPAAARRRAVPRGWRALASRPPGAPCRGGTGRWRLTAVLLLLAGLLPAAAAAESLFPPAAAGDPYYAGSLSIPAFRDRDGLPQNTVHAITLGPEGFLWVGTQDGAARYDGRRWQVWDMPQRERSNFVRCILAASDGSLWFGTQAAGLFRLRHGTWSRPAGGGLDLDEWRVNALLERPGARGPELWVATHNHGVLLLAGGEVTAFGAASGLPSERVWSLFASEDPDGTSTVWAGTEGGLARLRPDGEGFTTAPGYPTDSVNSLAATRGADGRLILWAGTYGGGLARLADGRWTTLTTADGLPGDFITSLEPHETTAGTQGLWVGTDGGGLAHLLEGRITAVDTEAGLPSDSVYSLLETSAAEGTRALWIGTRNGGLARFKEGQWRHFHPVPDPAALPVTALLETRAPDGAPVMWFGTDGGGLARLESGHWQHFQNGASGLPDDVVQALLATPAPGGGTHVWAGTRHGGVARFDGREWTRFSAASGDLPNDMVQALLATPAPGGGTHIWAGTRGGLALFDGRRWTHFDTGSGLPHDSVLSLLATPGADGATTVWVGTSGGLARLDGGSWQQVDLSAVLANPAVQSLAVTTDPDGGRWLWVGTDGGGVARRSLEGDGEWLTLTDGSDPPLPNNVIYSILGTGDGRVYLLTNKGVARLTPRRPTPGEARPYDVFTFTDQDGLPLNQCNRGAGLVDGAGRLWVGTVEGAAAFDPAVETMDRAPKPLRVEVTAARGQGGRIEPGAVLAHDRDHLIFEVTLLSFFRQGDTRYRTQLVGLEAAPSPWTAGFRKEYASLPGGAYTFRVWARDYAGNTSGPQEVAFRVRPAPWLTPWAFLLYAAALALLAYAAVRARLQAQRRHARLLQALVDARTRQLKEANEILIELSYIDPLTGIANRRRFDRRLAEEWKRAVRAGSPLAVVMIDIDWFKPLNDTQGHLLGDRYLKAVASALADGLPRAGDSIARYGGEEFSVILPATDVDGALRVAEHLRRRVEALRLPTQIPQGGLYLTISCGVASLRPDPDHSPEELLQRADQALYEAKQQGKNRSVAGDGRRQTLSSAG